MLLSLYFRRKIRHECKIVWMASEIEFWPSHMLALLPTPHTFSPAGCYAIPALQRWGRKIKAILSRYFFLMENLL